MLDNLYPESIEESGNYLRLALNYIARYKLAYNPITFALWYEYAAGRNQKLIKEIHALQKENNAMDFKVILKLFRKHVAGNQLLLAEKKTSEFQSILTQMIQQLGHSNSELNDQGNTLKTYARNLGQTTSLDAVSSIAKNIVLQTKAMVAAGRTLKNHMDTTASEIDILKKELEGIKQAAKTDMLTGLLNRRGFDEVLFEAIDHAVADNKALSIILTDIDHFKHVNDSHGHLVGDNVLKMVAKLLKEHIKGKDIATRFGGEEFILILPETHLDGAFVLAEQIRNSLQTMRWIIKDSGDALGSITISLGVAQYKPDETVKSLIERADNALYLAKKKGRNKTMPEQDILAA